MTAMEFRSSDDEEHFSCLLQAVQELKGPQMRWLAMKNISQQLACIQSVQQQKEEERRISTVDSNECFMREDEKLRGAKNYGIDNTEWSSMGRTI